MLILKNSRFSGAVTLLIIIRLFSLPSLAKYSGGSGTSDNPYQIATAVQMNAIGANPGDWGMYFKLMADIDLSGFDGKDGRPEYNIIGPDILPETWEYDGTPFTGVFDGDGHVISHLTIMGQRYLGLFGLVGSGAVVKNLGVVAADIAGSEDIGAIAGGNGDLQIRHIPQGIVSGCYSTGAVTGDYCVGGLIGRNYGTVTDCYSTVTVSANSWVGGLVGSNDDGIVTDCYSAGAVAGVDLTSVGGLVGFSPGTVLRCVWDTQTSGQPAGAGGVGLTTAEMMDPQMLGLNGLGGDPNWVLDPGQDYPRLAWEGKTGGTIAQPNLDWLEGRGTADDPYRLSTIDHLIRLGRASVLWDKHLVLSADIDFQADPQVEHVFEQAMIPVFTGVFDGNGHIISHLMINGRSFLGLVGQLRSGAEVRNLGVVDANVTGPGNYLGGLVANNVGVVTQCYSSGVVSGGVYVGGLIGYNDYGGAVTGCHSAVAVSGYVAGGLTGYNGGAVTQCYSTGVVAGYDVSPVGGLVANGSMQNATACFWDTQTSGQAMSFSGTGKTTAEMQTASTFLEAGWDFVEETANGTEDIWRIDEGKDYPRLWWECTVFFTHYMPLDPNQYGIKTFEWIYGKAGEYTSRIGKSETVHYSSGPITGMQIIENNNTSVAANNGLNVSFLASGEWILSTDPGLTAHPPAWSFAGLYDGMIIDQGVWYLVKRDMSEWDTVDDQQILIDIQDAAVPEGNHNDSVVFWYLDTAYSFTKLDFHRKEFDLGITLPSSSQTAGYAVTAFEIYAPNTGRIARGDIEAATGSLNDLAVLKQAEQEGAIHNTLQF